MTKRSDCKSHIVKVNATKKFKFLGFAYSKGEDGLFIRVHPKALLKAKNKLRMITKKTKSAAEDALCVYQSSICSQRLLR